VGVTIAADPPRLAGVGEHLLLLAAGRPVLAGDIDDLIAGYARLTGPRADLPPSPGRIISVRHTDRQSTFLVALPAGPLPGVVAPGWRSEPLSLEDVVFTYLTTSAAPRRAEATAAAA
jgi:ABC-2 type transport system ATP-binding protein